jgi:hypothetical protein
MDRVTREAEQADANLAEASRRAAVRPRSAWSDDPSSSSVPNPASTSPLPNRVALPTLKPLDAILGALGEQVRELDLAAANAAAAAPESKYTSTKYHIQHRIETKCWLWQQPKEAQKQEDQRTVSETHWSPADRIHYN